MSAWNKVAQMSATRKLERARMEAVAKILVERKVKAENFNHERKVNAS
jgi:hypothetical protein